jgi:hypothetical protein
MSISKFGNRILDRLEKDYIISNPVIVKEIITQYQRQNRNIELAAKVIAANLKLFKKEDKRIL